MINKIKHITQSIIAFLTSFILLSLIILPENASGQAATATWALNANANVSTTGAITATAQAFGAGLSSTGYGADGVYAQGFEAAVCTPNATDYFEFTSTPNCLNDLTVTNISFLHMVSNGTRCFQLKYAIHDGCSWGSESQIGGDISVGTTQAAFTSGAISIVVTQGTTIRVRLYGATALAGRILYTENFVITGTTSVVSAVGAAGIITGTSYVCQNQSGVAYSIPAVTNALCYVWSLPSGATVATGANTNSITVNFDATATDGNVTVYGTAGTCSGAISPTYNVGVMEKPIIVTNPTSINYGCNGTPVSFSVVATGASSTGTFYQWQEFIVGWLNISNGGVYSGATTETLTISNPAGFNGRQYRCVVTGQCTPAATSTAATLTVLASGLSGTYTVGTTGNYARLELAFTAINTNGLVGNVILEIISDITETATASLNQWNNCGNSSYTVTIYPKTATRTISGSIATSLITLNGADNVTFNGKIDGTGTANSLILSNTNTAGSTLKFIADATYNTVKYCTLQGVSTTATTGVVWFSTATTTGNNNNTVTYCDIRDGASTPVMGIYSLGTTGKENINNTISYCNIFNQYIGAGGTAVGIYLENFCSKWTISNNSFYQTSSRASCSYRAILIAGSNGQEFNIVNNYIGGQAPNCTGTAMTFTNTGFVTLMYLIHLDVSTSGISNIIGNTIQNISWTGVPSSTSTVRFAAIVGVGRIEFRNNTIGDNSTSSISIIYNDNGTEFGALVGLYKLGDGDILNNTIGSFAISGTHGDVSNFYGIYVTGTLSTNILISNNVIGNASIANSIQIASGATPVIPFIGISFGTSGTYNSTATNNTIANISNNCTSASTYTHGISNVATGGTQSVIGNQIFNISTAGTSLLTTTYPVLCGIKNNNTTTGDFDISDNKIYSLSATANVAVNVHGILLYNATTGTNNVRRNFIHSINTTSNTAEQNGIFVFSGTATLSNNMIRLGIDKDGNSITASTLIRGIYKYSASSVNAYFNSVYIGGSGVTGAVYTYCYSRLLTAVDIVKNNIFFNARTGGTGRNYAISINAATTFTSDYNDLFVTGANGWIGNAGTGTFANWQAIPMDLNSRNLDPSFSNATGNSSVVDLHLFDDASLMIDKGAYLASVLTDYDGQQRKIGPTPPNNDGNDPCIGADERIIPPSAQSAYGIYIPAVQSTGTIADCEIYAIGGTPGGSGILVANPVSTNYANVDISTYQIITEQNIQCANTNISFTTTDGTPNWLLGNGSNPTSGTTSPIITQYSTIGRKDILESVKVFKDFMNITMVTPSAGFILGAPAGAGCPTTYSYTSSVAGSAGFTYSWSASTPGGCSATIALPTASTTNITFVNTTGYNQVFVLKLDITTECCGPLPQVVRYITIWPGPLPPAVAISAVSMCIGGDTVLSVTTPDPVSGYAYDWYSLVSGGSLYGSGPNLTVNPVLSGATNYYVQSTNSFGCPSARTLVTVTGTTPTTPTIPGNSVCGTNDVTLSVTGPIAGYTYEWHSGSCGGTVLQSSTSPSYTTTVTSSTTIWVSAVPPGCGSSLCATPLITYNTPPASFVWLGTIGGANNWFNTSNWTDGCLPSCSGNVTIVPLGIQPDIGFNASGGAACQNIDLQASATLSFSAEKAELTVCGDFTHAGTITTGGMGKIIFNGTTAQTYTKTHNDDLHDVTINNTAGTPTVTIAGASDLILDATGSLIFTSGEFITGSNKLIVKNPSPTAISGHSTSSYVAGILVRYINTTGSYDFPVGISNYEYSNLNFTSNTVPVTYITAKFTNPVDGTAPSGLTVNGTPVTTILDAGYWTLTPNVAFTGTYDITLTSRGQSNGAATADMHTVVKRANSGAAWATYETCHNNATQSGSGTNPITAKLTGMTSFSDAAIGKSTTAPLPIGLLNFTAVCEKSFIKCSWLINSEINNEYFILERSFDAENWEHVATIKGAGNSNEIKNYEYYDKSSTPGLIYYRLIQHDFDGKETIFNTTTVVSCESNDDFFNIVVYPNPANSEINLLLSSAIPDEGKIYIYNDIGMCVYSNDISIGNETSKMKIDIAKFSNGSYYIKCVFDKHNPSEYKFVHIDK